MMRRIFVKICFLSVWKITVNLICWCTISTALDVLWKRLFFPLLLKTSWISDFNLNQFAHLKMTSIHFLLKVGKAKNKIACFSNSGFRENQTQNCLICFFWPFEPFKSLCIFVTLFKTEMLNWFRCKEQPF
jgi:hypothetical protein